jgi:DNA-binding SARP family transcriptional activator
VRCGGDVLSEAARNLADAPSIARAQLAAVLDEAPALEPSVLRRLADDPDAEVRTSARAAEARLRSRPPAPLRVVSFGRFALFRGADPLRDPTLGRAKPRALVAALLCEGASVHRERLLEWLWPDLPPDRGLASLHSTLSAVRRALGPSLDRSTGSSTIVTEGETYRLVLRPEDEWDARHFLELARRADAAGPLEARIARLLEAEAARAGLFLPEWPYEEWAAQARSEIDRAFEEVVERLADAFLEARQPQAAISRYERLLGLDPEREAWHRALMRTYAVAGERALALRQFHLCRQLLRERLGVEPSAATQALFASLL